MTRFFQPATRQAAHTLQAKDGAQVNLQLVPGDTRGAFQAVVAGVAGGPFTERHQNEHQLRQALEQRHLQAMRHVTLKRSFEA